MPRRKLYGTVLHLVRLSRGKEATKSWYPSPHTNFVIPIRNKGTRRDEEPPSLSPPAKKGAN